MPAVHEQTSESRESKKFPFGLLVLDILGTIVLAVGVYIWVNDDHQLIPIGYQFPGYHWVMIVGGFVVTLPYVLNRQKQRALREAEQPPESSPPSNAGK